MDLEFSPQSHLARAEDLFVVPRRSDGQVLAALRHDDPHQVLEASLEVLSQWLDREDRVCLPLEPAARLTPADFDEKKPESLWLGVLTPDDRVLLFRIGDAARARTQPVEEKLRAALASAPAGSEVVFSFHGGGAQQARGATPTPQDFGADAALRELLEAAHARGDVRLSPGYASCILARERPAEGPARWVATAFFKPGVRAHGDGFAGTSERDLGHGLRVELDPGSEQTGMLVHRLVGVFDGQPVSLRIMRDEGDRLLVRTDEGMSLFVLRGAQPPLRFDEARPVRLNDDLQFHRCVDPAAPGDEYFIHRSSGELYLAVDAWGAASSRRVVLGLTQGQAYLMDEALGLFRRLSDLADPSGLRDGMRQVAVWSGASEATLDRPPGVGKGYQFVSTATAAGLRQREAVLRTERADELRRGGVSAPAPNPKDLSGATRTVYMSVSRSGWQHQVQRAAEQMAWIGVQEGFRVAVVTSPGMGPAVERAMPPDTLENVTLVELRTEVYTWMEDPLTTIGVDGTLVVVPPLYNHELTSFAILRERVRRFYGDADVDSLPKHPFGFVDNRVWSQVLQQFPDVNFGRQGEADKRGGYEGALALAEALGRPVRFAATYLEGGNVLTGSVGGRAFAIAGKDSAAIGRVQLALETRREVDAVPMAEVHALAAKDLGVDPARLFWVEQPGDFHIDVGISLLDEGTVLVNDAEAAAELQVGWLEEDHARQRPPAPSEGSLYARELYDDALAAWTQAGAALQQEAARIRDHARWLARYEEQTVKDLTAQSSELRVVRAPGRFFRSPGAGSVVAESNFLNCEAGASQAREGAYYTCLGGDHRAEALWASVLQREAGVPTRVYFLDPMLAREMVRHSGALGCLSKGSPV